jgi:hypothetical protein
MSSQRFAPTREAPSSMESERSAPARFIPARIVLKRFKKRNLVLFRRHRLTLASNEMLDPLRWLRQEKRP